jgi:hypothetical protein
MHYIILSNYNLLLGHFPILRQCLTLDLQVNGLDMLRKAGIQVILDHHVLSGA